MTTKGLYVIDSRNIFSGDCLVQAKLSGLHIYVTDELIIKAKKLAKECQLSKFAIIYINSKSNTRQPLYTSD